MPDESAPRLSPEGQARAFDQLFTHLVKPELEARPEAGAIGEDFELFAAQVVIKPGADSIVRLNEEVRGSAVARAATEIRPGQEVGPREVADIEEFMLLEDDEPDAGHVTFLRLGDSWSMSFDFRYNGQRISDNLALADQFLDVASKALDAGHLHAFVENAYAAAELCAKSDLISAPDEQLLASKKHQAVHSRYHQHAHLGNTKPEFAALLKDLWRRRQSARYGGSELDLDEQTAREWLGTLRELRARAETIRPRRAPAEPAPN